MSAPLPPSAGNAGLRVTDLTVMRGPHEVLHAVSLTVARGEHVAVVGPSGSGKTTLLRALAGFVNAEAGSIDWEGEAWAGQPGRAPLAPEVRRVGLVAQDLALWPHLRAADHVRFALAARGVPRAQRAAEADALLDRVGLLARRHHRPPALSGGEAQRLAIARALAGGARVLLLDEPFGQLDVALRREIGARVTAMARDLGAAVLHVTHDPEDAMNLAERVVVLVGGRVEQDGPPRALRDRPASEFVARLCGHTTFVAAADVARVRSSFGWPADATDPPMLPGGVLAVRPDHLRLGHGGVPAQRRGATYSGGRWLVDVEALGYTWRVPDGDGETLHTSTDPGSKRTSFPIS